MFSEWTDPYDIDNYYGDINGLLRDVPQAPSSNMYHQLPIRPKIDMKPELPTGPIVNAPSGSQASEKSQFEVKPMSIFLDGHPVGQQPQYNILQSGPPSMERQKPTDSFIGTKEHLCNKHGLDIDWLHVIIFIMFMIVVGMFLQTRCEMSNIKSALGMLMYSTHHQR